MSRVVVALSREQRDALWGHLLRTGTHDEEAAFLFVRPDEGSDLWVWRVIEWFPVDRGGFAYQSSGYLELVDDIVARLIKRAHDLHASIVELHSHPSPWPAEFSTTDLRGLADFVPHVRWRLKGAPYAAIVVAPSGFDGLVWAGASPHPEKIEGLLVDDTTEVPTNNTHDRHFGQVTP